MSQPKWYRRRALYAALVVGLLAAAIPVSQSLASATKGTATVPIEKKNRFLRLHRNAEGHREGDDHAQQRWERVGQVLDSRR